MTCRFFKDANRVVLVTDNGDFNLKDYWLKNMSLYGTTKNAIFLQFDENDITTIFMGYEARENRVDLKDTFFVELWPL